jgi:16S rRNA (adenine1518-N6/adenine1519-N6)-dimethyltransferase
MISHKKALGQNFLNDAKIADDLIAAAHIRTDDIVIEIGAGSGIVTQQLADKAQQIYAIEFDRDLIPVLETNLRDRPNVKLINEDALDLNFPELIQNQPYKIVGSLPYQITSPLIHKIIIGSRGHWPEFLAFIIQKEVAEKIVGTPQKLSYLGNIVRLYGEPQIIRIINKEDFIPVPKVDGAIIQIRPEERDNLPDDLIKFRRFLRRAFSSPRKMINKVFSSTELERVKINPQTRPETIGLGDWFRLYHSLNS